MLGAIRLARLRGKMSEQLPATSGAHPARPASAWLAAAAILVAIAPLTIFPSLMRLPFVLVAVALGVWALIVALRTREKPHLRRTSSVLAVVAALAAIVAVGATIIGLIDDRERPRLVSVEAAGADMLQVEYPTSIGFVSQTWGSGDRQSFLSSGDQTTVHVTAMMNTDQPLTCKIFIDNELVVTESSNTNEVSCTYEYPWR